MKIKVIYAGQRIDINNKPYHQFYYYDTNESIRFSKIPLSYKVGCEYNIDKVNETKYILTAIEFIREHTIEKLVTEYTIEDIQAKTFISTQKDIKKITSRNHLIIRVCKPLNDIYNNGTKAQKQALLAYVIELITK